MVRLLNKKGIILIVAYEVIIAAGILIAASAYKAYSELNLATRNELTTEALYMAESGLTWAVYDCANRVADPDPAISNPPTDSTNPWFQGTGDNIILKSNPDYQFNSSYTDYNISYECYAIEDETPAVGFSGFERRFRVTATATNSRYGGITTTVNQIILCKKRYTFQHTIFYTDDLEMLPGPDMTITGRIHSNSDIYIGAEDTLTVDSDSLHSAGDIYNKRKDSSASMDGDVKILSDSYELMKKPGEAEPLDCDRSDWETESQIRWNGNVKSGVHGVTALAVPSVGSIKPDGFYAAEAGIKIVNGTITQGGFPLVEGADIPPGTVRTTTTFYNNREEKWVRMTEVDIQKLTGWEDANDKLDLDGSGPNYPNHLPANGLIYAARDDTGSGQQPGTRLINGSEIESPVGLTVVSNDPVYIQGDYNNVNKKPSAIICDAVNILSNAWDDSNSQLRVNDRVAADTTLNTAFISGIDTTTWDYYNGGVENYPRFHEKWSGKTLFIRGSFIALWNSEVAQGAWVYGDPQYRAPKRDWDYDTDFNNPSNLPPLTPFAVGAENVIWWKS